MALPPTRIWITGPLITKDGDGKSEDGADTGSDDLLGEETFRLCRRAGAGEEGAELVGLSLLGALEHELPDRFAEEEKSRSVSGISSAGSSARSKSKSGVAMFSSRVSRRPALGRVRSAHTMTYVASPTARMTITGSIGFSR